MKFSNIVFAKSNSMKHFIDLTQCSSIVQSVQCRAVEKVLNCV